MSKKRPRQTFGEIVEEVRARPVPPRVGEHAVRPGLFNVAGEFFDPAGNLLMCQPDDLDPLDAQGYVKEGALVAFESCGCGGHGPDCHPSWPNRSDRERMMAAAPQRTRGPAPTWIDLWSGDDGSVVFLHGQFEWAGVL